jgi:predicted O-methyltransferase YrrM
VSATTTEGPRRGGELLQALLAAAPSLHGHSDDRKRNLQLAPEVLRFLYETVQPDWQTVETGTGYSTIVFAARSGRHTAISPVDAEHQRIHEWCREHGVPMDHVTFMAARSEAVLPALSTNPVDLALVDGGHKFPIPFIDWFYLAGRLKVGGLMVIDDTQIRTGDILKRFLSMEEGRWALHATFPRTVVFRKEVEDWFGAWDWPWQPFCAEVIVPRRGLRQVLSRYHPLRWLRRLRAAGQP